MAKPAWACVVASADAALGGAGMALGGAPTTAHVGGADWLIELGGAPTTAPFEGGAVSFAAWSRCAGASTEWLALWLQPGTTLWLLPPGTALWLLPAGVLGRL